MPLDPRVYLADIQQACRLVVQITQGKTFTDYDSELVLRLAVERLLITTGEAVTQLLKVEPSFSSALSDTKRIIAFRNTLVHRYGSVSHATVWKIIRDDVPVLLREVDHLLKTA